MEAQYKQVLADSANGWIDVTSFTTASIDDFAKVMSATMGGMGGWNDPKSWSPLRKKLVEALYGALDPSYLAKQMLHPLVVKAQQIVYFNDRMRDHPEMIRDWYERALVGLKAAG